MHKSQFCRKLQSTVTGFEHFSLINRSSWFNRSKDVNDTSPTQMEVAWMYSEFIIVYWNLLGSPLRPFYCLLTFMSFCLTVFLFFCYCVLLSLFVLVHLQFISVHPNSLEVVLVPPEACFVHSDQKNLQVDWMGRDWLVIIGHRLEHLRC